MKSHFKLFFMVLISMTGWLFSGCEKDPAPFEEGSSAETKQIREYLVNNMGFSNEMIVEGNAEFIVEGDIVFKKAGFWEAYGMAESNSGHRSFRHQYLVSPYPQVVSVYCQPSVPSYWTAAVASAISQWNSQFGRITFAATTSAANANISIGIYPYGGLSSYYAFSTFPTSDNRAGRNITINSNCDFYHYLSTATKKKCVMMHELAHTIGIRHTNVVGDAQSYSIVTNNALCDPITANTSSLMNPIVPSTGFTACDLLALNTVYP